MQSLVMRGARLSFAGCVIVALLVGCKAESPTAPAPTNANVRGTVYEESGSCLAGATVEILDGPQGGTRLTRSVCQGTSDESFDGYTFRDLPPNIDVQVRASKEGYRSQEITLHLTAARRIEANFVLLKP